MPQMRGLKAVFSKPKSIAFTNQENVNKSEVTDYQRLPKTSIFGHFRAEILFVSKRWPFLEAKIGIILTIQNKWTNPLMHLAAIKKDENEKNMQR